MKDLTEPLLCIVFGMLIALSAWLIVENRLIESEANMLRLENEALLSTLTEERVESEWRKAE
jgi:hypothetical protein